MRHSRDSLRKLIEDDSGCLSQAASVVILELLHAACNHPLPFAYLEASLLCLTPAHPSIVLPPGLEELLMRTQDSLDDPHASAVSLLLANKKKVEAAGNKPSMEDLMSLLFSATQVRRCGEV